MSRRETRAPANNRASRLVENGDVAAPYDATSGNAAPRVDGQSCLDRPLLTRLLRTRRIIINAEDGSDVARHLGRSHFWSRGLVVGRFHGWRWPVIDARLNIGPRRYGRAGAGNNVGQQAPSRLLDHTPGRLFFQIHASS